MFFNLEKLLMYKIMYKLPMCKITSVSLVIMLHNKQIQNFSGLKQQTMIL